MSLAGGTAASLLNRWLPAAKKYFYVPAGHPEIMCYGTGESYHWAVQTNTNVFAALAVLSMSDRFDEEVAGMSREALQDTALRLLRYTLYTHKSAELRCANGQQWGKSWISGLSLERMRHGLDIIRPLMTEADHAALRRVMLAESDFLLDEYEIKAGMGFYENRPESNTWNGAVLLRSAVDYPDAPRRDEYLERATTFFNNAISIPADAVSEEIFRGRRVRDRFIGANFTENFSLNHNGYQNMGYAALTMSNVGFLHFSFKMHGVELPPEVYRHSYELWQVLKNFFFPDGRLLRIGGDARVRYCYCQDYAVPAWLFVMDKFRDPLAAAYEARWQKIVGYEARLNEDREFLSGRLAEMRRVSPFYYTRLEGDRAVSLSYSLGWRDAGVLDELPVPEEPAEPAEFNWSDETHQAALHRSRFRAASMTWDACFRPMALFVPVDRSDMAEWHHNLTGELITSNPSEAKVLTSSRRRFEGGFVSAGAVEWTEKSPRGEGELEAVYARHAVAFAALPDGRSAVVLQHAVTARRIYLRRIQGLGYKMPNDIFNDCRRLYRHEGGSRVVEGIPGREETIVFDSPWLGVDDALFIRNIYGGKGFTIYRPAGRQIPTEEYGHTSIHADEICTAFEQGDRFAAPGETVLDCGALLSVEKDAASDVRRIDLPGALRAAAFTLGGVEYALLANFGEEAAAVPGEFSGWHCLGAEEFPASMAGYQAYLMRK